MRGLVAAMVRAREYVAAIIAKWPRPADPIEAALACQALGAIVEALANVSRAEVEQRRQNPLLPLLDAVSSALRYVNAHALYRDTGDGPKNQCCGFVGHSDDCPMKRALRLIDEHYGFYDADDEQRCAEPQSVTMTAAEHERWMTTGEGGPPTHASGTPEPPK